MSKKKTDKYKFLSRADGELIRACRPVLRRIEAEVRRLKNAMATAEMLDPKDEVTYQNAKIHLDMLMKEIWQQGHVICDDQNRVFIKYDTMNIFS